MFGSIYFLCLYLRLVGHQIYHANIDVAVFQRSSQLPDISPDAKYSATASLIENVEVHYNYEL